MIKLITDTAKEQAAATAKLAEAFDAVVRMMTAPPPATPHQGWVSNDLTEWAREVAREAELQGFPATAPPEDQLRWLEREMSKDE